MYLFKVLKLRILKKYVIGILFIKNKKPISDCSLNYFVACIVSLN